MGDAADDAEFWEEGWHRDTPPIQIKRTTAADLRAAGWHTVRYKLTHTLRWCHGGKKNSYTFHEAVRVYERDQQAGIR